MIDDDDITTRLRSQMHTATAADVAPADLLDRVHRAAARRRHRRHGALALSAVAAAAAVVALPAADRSAPPARLAATPDPSGADGLTVLRADSGRTALRVTVDGKLRTEQVELPGYLHNAGPAPVTVLSISVPRSTLTGDFPPQVLAPGGDRPLTLVRKVNCDADPALPTQLDLRVRLSAAGQETSVLLPLPESVVSNYRTSHACSPQRRAADDAAAQSRPD
jgi:hypothetical protein